MYHSYNGANPYLEQWEAAIGPIVGGIRSIFGGGKKGPSESERIAAARSIAQQRLAAISDLPSKIRKIEGWLSHNSIYWECKQWEGKESTQGRACIIEACLVARQLGWTEPGFSDCNPLMKAPITFTRLEPLVLAFFRQKLPELKAALAGRQVPRPIAKVEVTPWPTKEYPWKTPPTVTPPEPGMPPPPKEKAWWEKLLEKLEKQKQAQIPPWMEEEELPPEPGRPIPGPPGPPGAPGAAREAGIGGIDPNTLLIGGGVALAAILLSQGQRRRR